MFVSTVDGLDSESRGTTKVEHEVETNQAQLQTDHNTVSGRPRESEPNQPTVKRDTPENGKLFLISVSPQANITP